MSSCHHGLLHGFVVVTCMLGQQGSQRLRSTGLAASARNFLIWPMAQSDPGTVVTEIGTSQDGWMVWFASDAVGGKSD